MPLATFRRTKGNARVAASSFRARGFNASVHRVKGGWKVYGYRRR